MPHAAHSSAISTCFIFLSLPFFNPSSSASVRDSKQNQLFFFEMVASLEGGHLAFNSIHI